MTYYYIHFGMTPVAPDLSLPTELPQTHTRSELRTLFIQHPPNAASLS